MTTALLLASIVTWKIPDTSTSAILMLGAVSVLGVLARFIKNNKK